MKPLNVVIAQRESKIAEGLARDLQSHFKMIAVARDLEEMRRAVPKHRADVAIIDLEAASLIEVDQLRREYPELTIVCTHRLADERMWQAALSSGAQDCCHPSDARSIVLAANRTQIMSRTTAA